MTSPTFAAAGVAALLAGAPHSEGAPRNLTWADIARELGCPKKVHEQTAPKGDSVIIEYVPKGETVERWTRMVTFTLVRVPADDKGANKAVHESISVLRKSIKASGGEPTTWQVEKGSYGEVLFAEYTIKGEWNATVLSRTAHETVAAIALAGHGGAPTARQRDFLRAQIGLAPLAAGEPPGASEQKPGDALASRWFKVTSGGLIGSEEGVALSLGLKNEGRQAIWTRVRFELPDGREICEKTAKLARGQDELLSCPHASPTAEKDYPVRIAVFTEPGWRQAVELTEMKFRFSRQSIKTMERGVKELQRAKRP